MDIIVSVFQEPCLHGNILTLIKKQFKKIKEKTIHLKQQKTNNIIKYFLHLKEKRKKLLRVES